MNESKREVLTHHFIEEVALLFEAEGLPRMNGRIIGHLLICDPPQQSSAQLAEALRVSRGAISQATRALLQMGLIHRAPVPGRRAMFFEMRSNAFDRLLHGAIARITLMRQLADRGLDLMSDAPKETQGRLRAFREMYVFMEDEFPKMMERWDSVREESR